MFLAFSVPVILSRSLLPFAYLHVQACGLIRCVRVDLASPFQVGVVWPRCIERDARFAAGLESSFSSFGETSLVVLTLRYQIGNGGETAE